MITFETTEELFNTAVDMATLELICTQKNLKRSNIAGIIACNSEASDIASLWRENGLIDHLGLISGETALRAYNSKQLYQKNALIDLGMKIIKKAAVEKAAEIEMRRINVINNTIGD